MSKVAVWRFSCCNRLFYAGRFEGKSDSTSGFYPKSHCRICNPRRPALHEYVSTCEFAGYTFDDLLDRPFTIGVNYLSQEEIEKFLRYDKSQRERCAEHPYPGYGSKEAVKNKKRRSVSDFSLDRAGNV